MSPPRTRTQAWISTVRAIALVPLLGGCALWGSPVPAGRPVREVYEDTDGPHTAKFRIEQAPLPGQVERTRPVIYPPKVFAVWVPEHLDFERDMKIGAHWVYIKLRDSSWMEEPIDREPGTSECAAPAEVAPLRERLGRGQIERLLVPFQASSPPGPAEVSDERGGRRPRGERP